MWQVIECSGHPRDLGYQQGLALDSDNAALKQGVAAIQYEAAAKKSRGGPLKKLWTQVSTRISAIFSGM